MILVMRELAIGYYVGMRFVVSPVASTQSHGWGYANEVALNGHLVRLADDSGHEGMARQVTGQIRILIDGRDYSSPHLSRIQVGSDDSSRYTGSAFLFVMEDRFLQRKDIVVAEYLGSGGYRVLTVSTSGRVLVDTFGYRERCWPSQRAMAIRWVSPQPMGYCSDVMATDVTPVWPVVYPLMTGAVGIVCLLAGLLSGSPRRRGDATLTVTDERP
jgi:hypothetical protein